MDQPTNKPLITAPTLPKDIALPKTPAASHFLQGSEHLKKEEVEAEFKGEEETKSFCSGEEEQVLEDTEPKLNEAHLDETAQLETILPSSSPIVEHQHQPEVVEEASTPMLEEDHATPHALPLKNDEPILSTTSQEPEVVEAQDSETVEPSPAQQKVEEVVETSPPLGLHLETQAPEVPGGPAFPSGPTVGSPLREAANLSPLSPIQRPIVLPSDDIEPQSEISVKGEAMLKDVEGLEKPEEVDEQTSVFARQLDDEEELVPLEEVTKVEPIAIVPTHVSALALDTAEPEVVPSPHETPEEVEEEPIVSPPAAELVGESQEAAAEEPVVEEVVEEEKVVASETEPVATLESSVETQEEEVPVASSAELASAQPVIEELPSIVEPEEVAQSSETPSDGQEVETASSTADVESREEFHRSTNPSPSWSRIDQTPGAEEILLLDENVIVDDPEETITTSAFEYPLSSPPIPDAHVIFARKRSASQPSHVPLPEEQILGHPVVQTPLERQLSNSDQAALFSGSATLEDIVGPNQAVEVVQTNKLEEVVEVPAIEAEEEEKSVAEELDSKASKLVADVETKDAPVELVEKKTEPNLESELQEERTPVLVTPPKDAPSSPSPSTSSVKPVFVDQAPTLVGGSMLAELLDEKTPALEYTEEELRNQRTSATPVVASVEEVPLSSELEVKPQAPSGAADSYFSSIPGSDANDEETPLPKTEEEVRLESVEEDIGEGVLGAAGATLAGIALYPAVSEDVEDLNEDQVKAEIVRAEAEVGSDSEETVDEAAWEGGSPLARSPPQFASMTDPSPRESSSLPVVNGLAPLPTIPLATSGAVPVSVLDRIDQHHQLKFASGDGLETSTSSNWAESSSTPFPPTTPVNEFAAPNLIHAHIAREPSPAVSPGEVFGRGDVPSGTLVSPTGDRKHGDQLDDTLDTPEESSPSYFGSSLPLPREVDYATESIIVAGERPRKVPVVPGGIEVSPPFAHEPLATKEDEVEVEVGRDEVDVNVHQPKIVSTSKPNSTVLASGAQPSSTASISTSPEATEAPPAPIAPPPPTNAIPETMNLSWSLKDITWPDPRVGGLRREVKIVCQSANGPCSLISLVNVLALRGSIHIDPSRHHVSYDYLSSLIGDFLIERPQDSKLSLASALSILPTTVEGLNLNPSFLSPSSFQQEGDGGELALFELCGVRLTHGWVVENDEDRELFSRVGTWDAAQGVLVEGQVAEAELEKESRITDDGMKKIEDANRVRTFLDSTRTQLTPTGLRELSASLDSQEVVALFRNSHLSVLYKRPAAESADPEDPLLFSLVTDESFRSEPEVVWEPLADVHTSTGFVNSDFITSSTAGGDIAGLSAEEVGRRADLDNGVGEEDLDRQLAKQLQSEEDAEAAAALATSDRRQTSSSSRRGGIPPTPSSPPAETRQSTERARARLAGPESGGSEELKKAGEKKKEKKGCVVM